MNAVAGKSVTITLSNPYRKPIIEVGELVRIKRKKRVWGEVIQSDYETAKIKAIYRPAPKSRLNNKSKFSKFKMKIIKLNT